MAVQGGALRTISRSLTIGFPDKFRLYFYSSLRLDRRSTIANYHGIIVETEEETESLIATNDDGNYCNCKTVCHVFSVSLSAAKFWLAERLKRNEITRSIRRQRESPFVTSRGTTRCFWLLPRARKVQVENVAWDSRWLVSDARARAVKKPARNHTALRRGGRCCLLKLRQLAWTRGVRPARNYARARAGGRGTHGR